MAAVLPNPPQVIPVVNTIQDSISVQHVTHRYGDRVALRDLSFDVGRAEIFGLLGPNGSGKTTLFRILSTLMVPSEGRCLIAGFDVSREPQRVRSRIGIVFQAKSVDPKLTVAENLKHQGHLYRLHGSALKQRIGDILQRVALADRAKDAVETLSGGMQRRVELAKGLIHKPSVLLLDEPSTGLDPGARIDLWQYLRMLRDEENVSILVTSHLMEEAEKCDRLAILNQGALVALGTPLELKSQIGGDVITLESPDPKALAENIAQRFGVTAAIVDNAVRMERANGHRFVTEVVESFPGAVTALSVSKPSLEDVFISRTGHRFWTEEESDSSQTHAPGKASARHNKGGKA